MEELSLVLPFPLENLLGGRPASCGSTKNEGYCLRSSIISFELEHSIMCDKYMYNIFLLDYSRSYKAGSDKKEGQEDK